MGSIFKPSVTTVQAPSQSTTSYDIPEYFKEIQGIFILGIGKGLGIDCVFEDLS